MRDINWNSVQEAVEFKNPTAGGYAARIIDVEDREDSEFLLITWDFADGDFKGSNADMNKRLGFYPHHAKFVRSYKESALPFFKGFKTAVEKSNPGYIFQNNPQSLIGKFIGVVLGEEEYKANSGQVKTRLYTAEVRSGQVIREGFYKIPDLKRMEGNQTNYQPGKNDIYAATGDPRGDFAILDDDDAQLPF